MLLHVYEYSRVPRFLVVVPKVFPAIKRPRSADYRHPKGKPASQDKMSHSQRDGFLTSIFQERDSSSMV